MNGVPLFWIALSSLSFTCLAAVGVRALRDFSRRELQEVCIGNGRPERFGQILRSHAATALGVEMLGAITAAIFVAAAVCWRLDHLATDAETDWRAVAVVAAMVGVAMAVFRVGVPWSIARVYAEPFLYHTWPFWRLLGSGAAPLAVAVNMIDGALHRFAGRVPEAPDEETVEQEIRTIVTEGHRGGLLEEDAREMIEGVIDMGDADVSQIMTPRTDMHMVQADLAWEAMLADVIQMGHTRIPVYDGSRDDLIGVLYVKDLLPELARPEGEQRRDIREIVRKPIFVPDTKKVDDLLEMFQQERTHIAIVLDEYGGVSGLVTIEDVLEEIVGDIVDEYDDVVEDEIRRLDDGSFEAVGRAHVDEVNEAVGAELPEDDDYDTIAGFVFTQLGRVPTVGEQVLWEDTIRVTVLEATRRRIERVRVEQLAAPAESA